MIRKSKIKKRVFIFNIDKFEQLQISAIFAA